MSYLKYMIIEKIKFHGLYIIWVLGLSWFVKPYKTDHILYIPLHVLALISHVVLFFVFGWLSNNKNHKKAQILYMPLTAFICVFGSSLWASVRWGSDVFLHFLIKCITGNWEFFLLFMGLYVAGKFTQTKIQ